MNLTTFIRCIALLCLFSLISACGTIKNDPYLGKNIPELDVIQEIELETRFGSDAAADNYEAAALYLTDFDRRKNNTVMLVTRRYKYAGSNQFVPILNESCDKKTDRNCGLIKLDATTRLEDVTLSSASAIVQSQDVRASHDIDEKEFAEGSVWLLLVEENYIADAPNWRKLLAIELKRFAPNSWRVVLRYKVLEYRRL